MTKYKSLNRAILYITNQNESRTQPRNGSLLGLAIVIAAGLV